jgi:cytosine/adenosine deaminase-related metal-dependent hydrolase
MPRRLISAAWVVPIDRPLIQDGAVVLDATDAVVAIGGRADLRARHPDAVEERAAGALLPGLVNAHCHLELSALAGVVPGGTGIVAWTRRLITAAAAIPPAQAALAAMAAARAAVCAGTAAIGDVGNSLGAIPAIAAAGLRGVFFHELVGSREARPGGALADAARERATLPEDDWPPGLAYQPAPHAPYSVGPELLTAIFERAAESGLPTSIHVAEDPDELALLRDGTGRWPAVLRGLGVDPATRVPRLAPVAYLAARGAFAAPAPPLLVHMVHAGAEDRRLARAAGATAVLCPRSNLHITGDLPDVEALREDGVALAIGTDSLASSDDLSPWGEIATLREHFPSIPPAVWLEAATTGGARALHLPAFGALAPGLCPGVIDVALDDPRAPLESLTRNPQPDVHWRGHP